MSRTDIIMNWYVAYTRPRTERIADEKLKKLGIHSFFPQMEVIKQWSDRRKKIMQPLFPNYLFIRSTSVRLYDLLQVKELVRFVSFEGKPAIISDEIVSSLTQVLNGNMDVMVQKHFEYGTHVRITEGHLSGLCGLLVRNSGKAKFIIQIDSLNTQVAVEVPFNTIENQVDTQATSTLVLQ